MTIIYDASDHFGVLCNLHGSIWPRVLPFCLLNVIFTVVIYNIPRYFPDVDITFDGGVGFQFLSVLVSFFTIDSLSTTYNRFWEARAYLGDALAGCSMLAARAALFTAHDDSDKADAWRQTLKQCITRLIDEALFMIQDDHACLLFNVIDSEGRDADLQRQGLKKTKGLMRSLSHVTQRKKDVVEYGMDVDAAILTVNDHVREGGNDAAIGDLLGRSAGIVEAYFKLIKFSTTPRPFVLTQMGRTLTFLWVFALPAAVLNTHPEEPYEAMFLVFIVTYGFIGMTLVQIELHDPLGNDENDLETERYLGLIKHNIEKYLGKHSQSSEGTLLASPYEESGANARPNGARLYQSV